MTKFKSDLERRVASLLGKEWMYEPGSYPYVTNRKYIPDFVYVDPHGDECWIEVKGFFRAGDTAKYKAIRQCYPDVDLVFCFHAPHKKVRKGSKITMCQWAEKNGWRWTTPSEIEEEGI